MSEQSAQTSPVRIDASAFGFQITLRPVMPEDLSFLYILYSSVRQAEIDAWGWTGPQREAFLQMQFRAHEKHYDAEEGLDRNILLDGGRAIGQLIVVRSPAEICLADIALLPEYRGRGIGGGLIGGLLSEGREARLPVRLHVARTNPAARLYARLGFITTADDGLYLTMEWRPESAF